MLLETSLVKKFGTNGNDRQLRKIKVLYMSRNWNKTITQKKVTQLNSYFSFIICGK